jgi:signal transduction histidine kinase
MVGYADILLEDALAAGGDEARRLVERIRGHGVLLHGLISDLLDYAKVEAGKMDVHAEPIRVRELVEGVADRFRPLTTRKGLDLATVCREELPEIVTDRQRVEQILTNLVGNAVKFTERGAITIEARATEDVDDRFMPLSPAANGVAPAGPGVVIMVRDTGIGIRQDDVARLAGDFEQLEHEAAARYGGTGLGLSISRRLAHRLGGRIAVRSRYAEGSTFALFLPLAV